MSSEKLPNQPIEPVASEKTSRSMAGVAGEHARVGTPGESSCNHPERTGLSLDGLAARLSPALAAALPPLLAEAPDPEGALLRLERLSESEETVRLLEQHHFLAHYAVMVCGHSRFLGETLVQNRDLLVSFLREKNLDRSFSREEFHQALARFRARSFETDVSLLLARFKRREYVRIMLRDVLKIAPLAETTAEISALADALIEAALRESESRLRHRYGTAQHVDATGRLVDTPFAILALGKLGGNELNYSSDVDLLYLHGDGEEPPGASISNREYFIHLAQQTTATLVRLTREGPVFRIDLRLRPQGGEGELAIGFSHALAYYTNVAHDWERQALIKVRHAAGDANLAREFIRAVQPHVYTPEVNFAAIKTALMAREKMHRRRRQTKTPQPPEAGDVKLDRGGIRDIEFLVQCLQRVYGGAEPWLRSGGTLFSLHKLHDKGHISGKEFHDLTSAYEFLRHVEHRLQLREGQQTHRLPTQESEARILQRAMEGYGPGQQREGNLTSLVQERMAAVAEIYERVIYQQRARGVQRAPAPGFQLFGPFDPAAAPVQASQPMLERLAVEAPSLHEVLSHRKLGVQGRKNLLRFLGSAFSSSQSYGTVLRNQEALARAATLFESSEYLSEILIRHPDEIVTLATLEEERAAARGTGLFELASEFEQTPADPVFAYLANSPLPYSEKLALLRQHFRHRAFVVGARDILQKRNVYDSFADMTAAAEAAIATAFNLAGSPQSLAVMALGRLGSGEFGLLSDADLLFVCGEEDDHWSMTKCAEQVMHVLGDYTREGMVFPVDVRLRPRGTEGELVLTPTQLAVYFEQEAQAWEALMYTKLRLLAGSQAQGRCAISGLPSLFARFAADSGFGPAVCEMRGKLEALEAPEKSFKFLPGGLYDVDFITSVLLIKAGIANRQGSQRDRLWRCAAAGALDKSDAAKLDHATEMLRTAEHVSRLVAGRVIKWLPPTEHGRQVAERIAGQVLQREFAEGLEKELENQCREVRAIYLRVLDGGSQG